ncbi:MAG TPA: VWA domain-containing protein [Bacteroidia bacterium]|nr:VWA domain-containing protein [Bacteroidia bacterium]
MKKLSPGFLKIFLLAAAVFFSTSFPAQTAPTGGQQLTRILFVFDASFSMFGQWQSGSKMEIAKRLLSNFLDSLKNTKNLEMGLRCYGHQHNLTPTRDCQDTKLEVPIAKPSVSIPAMQNKIAQLVPRGTTPIAYTLEQCGGDFPKDGKNARNIVILITDGIEECDGDPCAVSLSLQQQGIILKPFVIGVGLSGDYSTLGCIGHFYDVSQENTFTNVLNIVVSEALNNTTCQVNLLDLAGKPTETDVAMTFYDQQTGVVRYNYMHTMNNRGVPDTITLDPLSTYKLVVHTIPEVVKENITVTPGKHNIIAVDAPQGYLNLQVAGINNYSRLQCIIRKAGTMETVNVQDFGRIEKYIVGKYDLEILSLPRIYMYNVDVGQSKTTLVQIPQAGVVNIAKPSEGTGQILLDDKNKLTFVCNLNDQMLNESVVLQPGNYRVIYRSKSAHETVYTVEKKFKIDPGGQAAVKLY